MNDMPLVIENATIDMYSNDLTIQNKVKTIDELESKLNSDLVNVSQWLNENKMPINKDKTFSMLITTYQKARRLPKQHLDLILNSSSLQPVTSQKLLGVKVDHYLNWKEHITVVCRTVSHNIALLRFIKK